MTAKEMFEELGYYYRKTNNEIIVFEVWQNGLSELHHNEILRFKKYDRKWWELQPKKILHFDLKNDINIKLFKAINKQIEELGWLE